MTEWREVALEDLCDRVTVGHVGKMVDQYAEDGVPYLRSQNIRPFAINRKGLLHINKRFHQRLAKSTLRTGDVVVIRTGYPGTAAVIPPDLDNSNCADLVVITPSDQLNPYMLAAVFNSAWGRSAVGGQLVGAAQQHFNIGSAKTLRIRLPGRDEQDRIAAILCALTDLIENNQQRIELLEQMAQAIYREWFVEFRYPGHEDVPFVESILGPIPDSWRVGLLSELVENRRSSVKPSPTTQSQAYVPIDCINTKSLCLREWRPGDEAHSSLIQFERDDILFGAMRPYFHKVALAPWPGTTRTTCFVLRVRDAQHWAYAALRILDSSTIDYATNHASGTTIPYARWDGSMSEMRIVIPPAEISRRFAEVVTPMLQFVQDGGSMIQNLLTTRSLLLPRLISGEIDVSKLDLDGVVNSV